MQNTLKIPEELYKKLYKEVESSDFEDVEELILYILQDYLDRKVVIKDAELTEDEEKLLRKRLNDLGYM